MMRMPLGGGRTLVAVCAFLALAGFFLPWILVLYGVTGLAQIDLGPLGKARTPVMTPYFVVLDASGYDLAFGNLSEQELGQERRVGGTRIYLAFLLGPIALALVAMGHGWLRAADRRATPVAVGLAAALLAGILLHRMYFDLRGTIETESAKRVAREQVEEASESFRTLGKKAVPRHQIGFWMALFGYAGVLSGAILWYREGMDVTEPKKDDD